MAYSVKMKRDSKPRSGMALGGIGAGTFEIRHDATTANWNIFNNLPLGWGPLFPFPAHSMLFFVAKWKIRGESPRMKLLQIEESHGAASLHSHEIQYIFPWMTGVDEISFDASFPFASFKFKSDDMPFSVEMLAWSSFIPFDLKNSSLPCACFDFKIKSKTKAPLDICLAASLRNTVAYDAPDRFFTTRTVDGANCRSFVHSCGGADEKSSSFGSMGISSLSRDSKIYAGWEHPHPYYERFIAEDKFPECDDTEARNKLHPDGKKKMFCDRCWSTAAVDRKLEKGRNCQHSFVVSWSFPNNYARHVEKDGHTDGSPHPSRIEGHYYSNFFKDSAEAGEYFASAHGELKRKTLRFHKAFFDSDAPNFLLDQVNSHLNTMFTSSWFTKEGHFGIIEGLAPQKSFAGLATTDVAMSGGIMYAALFPSLSRQINLDYAKFQNKDGSVAHSIRCNFETMDSGEGSSKRLDLPAQHAFMSLRDAFWANDLDCLKKIYPSAKAALDYVLAKRDMNKDGLPDMEGIMCSYDNFPMFGVSSFVAGQFILALKTLSQAAEVLGISGDAEKYGELFECGRRIFEEKLWNRSYFRLCNDQGGPSGKIDEGCLSDQLISQWAAYQTGSAPLYDEKKVRKAIRSIMRMNYKSWQGLRNCQWPGDKFMHEIHKDIWVDQANTCWTGVELSFAALCIYENLLDEGLTIVKNLDRRYRRNGMYFDHQEFGGHYFRPMSAWSLINAVLGFGLRNGRFSFSPKLRGKKTRLFFAAPELYGHFVRRNKKVSIEISTGILSISSLEIPKYGNSICGIEGDGKKLDAGISYSDSSAEIFFPEKIDLRKKLSICFL